jgi:hypothetical protein
VALTCAPDKELYNVGIMDAQGMPTDLDAAHTLIASLQSQLSAQSVALEAQTTELVPCSVKDFLETYAAVAW